MRLRFESGRPSLLGRLRRRSTLAERGAAMVEFALIAPIFFLVVFAGIEMGFVFRSDLTVEDMTRNAARVASIVRDNPEADRLILAEVEARSGSLPGEILSVTIFSAPTLNSDVPAGCIVSGIPQDVAGTCNSYEGDDLAGLVDGSIGVSTAFDPATREEWNVVGVHVRYRQPSMTGVIDNFDLSATTLEVIELDL